MGRARPSTADKLTYDSSLTAHFLASVLACQRGGQERRLCADLPSGLSVEGLRMRTQNNGWRWHPEGVMCGCTISSLCCEIGIANGVEQ